MNNNTDCFELIPCNISKIIFENNRDYIVGIEVEDKEYGLALNSYDGPILTFVDSGCATNPHINTIHQVFLKFLNNMGFTLSTIIIEAKYGDVAYCRLKWDHDQQPIFHVVSLGDALILHGLSQAPLFISKFVISTLENFDSDAYFDSFDE